MRALPKTPSENIGFDIVAANYNNGKFIDPLIESLLEQHFKSWHLTIVDDCSSDNSRDILTKYNNHRQITILYNDINLGVSATFDRGIRNGKNTLIGLIGSDDTLAPDALIEMSKAFHSNSNASLIYSLATECDEFMNPIKLWPHTAPLDTTSHISQQLLKVSNFIAIKRESYERSPGLNPVQKKAMDHDLILKMAEQGTIEHLAKPLYNYRRHVGGISQGRSGLLAAQYSLLAQLNASEASTSNKMPRALKNQKAHTYHTRSVFVQLSCTKQPLIWHALLSLLYIRSLPQLKTTLSAIKQLIMMDPRSQ